jgi:hypothetical protein
LSRITFPLAGQDERNGLGALAGILKLEDPAQAHPKVLSPSNHPPKINLKKYLDFGFNSSK